MKLLFSFFLFFLFVNAAVAQSSTIKGFVKNASDGSSVAGASVKIEGTNAATSTGVDGAFTIKGKIGDKITFSSVGFETKTLPISNTEINVSLSETIKEIDRVVVVGSTNRSSKKELGNAITSVKSKDLLVAQPTSLASALQGKVAGAQITQNSGDPAGGFSVKLRGTSSI